MAAPDLHHLPDIPHAGYSTIRQKQASDAVMFFLRGVERDRELLLTIVIDGREKWRKTAGKVWRGLLIDQDIIDSVFYYMILLSGPDPYGQRETLRQIQRQLPS
jgi:hypothetical protein